MLSSMTPTIVCDSLGNVELVTGARGGPFIITAVFQVLSNVVDYGMDLPTAISAPRIHHQHYPDYLRYEEGALTPATAEELRRRGYELKVAGGLGSTCSILRSNGGWTGVADPRTGGRAEGY
jgi:gamma-glutamyltranspeptidase/glutathione hydrolase